MFCETKMIHPAAFEVIKSHPHPLLFSSISGAHLYGFPSENSDWDIRGIHLLPLESFLGMQETNDTYEFMEFVNKVEIDLVTFDLKKFCNLIRRKNGNVLEQLISPLQISNSESADELRGIASRSLTRNHIGHYRGMAKNRNKAFQADKSLKAALYTLRALMTGIFLLEKGVVLTDLSQMKTESTHLEIHEKALVETLIEAKSTEEKGKIDIAVQQETENLILRLFKIIETSYVASTLPLEVPELISELNTFLVRCRLASK